MDTLGWVDWTLIALLALSVAVGLWRGLVYEVMSLFGWVVAYVAAQWAGPQVAPQVPVGTPGSGLNHGVAFALVFVGTLIVWWLAAKLVRLLLHATPLSVIDRALGAGFGLLRGAVLLLALATVVVMTPAAASPAWKQSQGASWLQAMLQELKPVLPADMARHLPAEPTI